ncbi:ABC transporter [Colletotrichum somersetense]|nr:ABC transporter [Colletotrichum somersetense]
MLTLLENRVSVAAAGFSFIDAALLGILSCIEHVRTIRPSTIICLFLLLSCLFDAVKCRTLWLLNISSPLATVFTTNLTLKLVIFVLEIQDKRKSLLAAWERLSPEATSGIVGRGFFWWLNGLLLRGFKTSLSPSALYDIDEELQSGLLLRRLEADWQLRTKAGLRKYSLLCSMLHCTRVSLFLGVLPRLLLIGFKFCQPFLIHRIINYVDGDRGPDTDLVKYRLIAATGFVYISTALSKGFYEYKLCRFIVIVRGTLTAFVLHRNLHPEGATPAGPIGLTLANTDVDTICRSFQSIHEIWANPIEIAVAVWLLQRQLGLGCLGPAITLVVCLLGTIRLSKYMAPAQKSWNVSVQQRIAATSTVISLMKETKILALESIWFQNIQKLRLDELAVSKHFRTLITATNIFVTGNAPSMLGPVVTFGISILASRVGSETELSVAVVFTSLSIMGLLMEPLSYLVSAIPSLISCLGSFGRIQAFVSKEDTAPKSPKRAGKLKDTNTSAAAGSSVEMTGILKDACTVMKYSAVATNASFSFSHRTPPILHSINLCIVPSTMTAVVGKVGSGKTSLLRGLLGELHTTGHLETLAEGAAYCAQSIWLINSSIEANIVVGSTHQDDWYETVIRACALEADLEMLPLGDQTIVGSRGQSLSGGQRQRVALARAIYSRKRVLVIDDALSGLDTTTQAEIWHRVFGPAGLARQYELTVIISTHLMSHLEDFDQIIVLGDDGRVSVQGTFLEVKKSPYVQSLSFTEASLPDANIIHGNAKVASRETGHMKPCGEAKSYETSIGKSGDTSLYWYYLKPIGWVFGVTSLVLAVLDTFCQVFPQVWLKFWTENKFGDGQANVALYFGIFATVSILGLGVIGVHIWFMFVKIIPRSSLELHSILLRTVMGAPLSFFAASDTGSLINRFSQDLSLVDRDLPIALFTTSSGVLGCLAEAILIILGAKYLAVLIPFALGVLYCLQAFYLRTSRQLRQLHLQSQAPLNSHFLEMSEGITTIKAFRWRAYFLQESQIILDKSQQPYYLLLCIQRWLALVLDLFVSVTAILLVTFVVLIPSMTNTATVAIALYNVLGFSQSLASIITSWTDLETSLGAVSRLRNFQEKFPPELPSVTPRDPPAGWPSRGQICINEVSASYSRGTELVLRNCSIAISPGQKVAICGRTGSGKSSLLLAILGLINLESGSVTIDGINISQVPTSVLRSRIISIPQNPVLFPGTLRSNLAPASQLGEIVDTNKIIDSLKMVGLWDVIHLHGGLDVDVDDLQLSQGQRQLLSFARAIVCKETSKILILDEANSSVDQKLENEMARIIEEEFALHTMVFITHRLQALRGLHSVVKLDEGRVVSQVRVETRY